MGGIASGGYASGRSQSLGRTRYRCQDYPAWIRRILAGKHVGDVVQLAGPPQERALGASELSAIERVARRYGAPSSTELSELSHQERTWVERADGDIIPYTEAFDVELIRRFRR